MSDLMSLSDVPDARSATFRDMADRLDRNADQDFGGAFVVIPPEGEAQTMLLIDSAKNPAIFWAALQTRVQIALQEIEEAQRGGMPGFGRR